jgi:hypothetical protein
MRQNKGMKKVIVAAVFALIAVSAAAEPDVVHIRDPFESCEKVTENERYGLSSLQCGQDSKATSATWLMQFDLGRWSAPYSRFTIFGGRELETVGRPRVSVGSCRRGCTYFQVESVKIPYDVLFSDEALTTGLQIKAVGGPRDLFLMLSPARIQRFRQGLIAAKFIENDGSSASWYREFKWPEPKQEGAAPPQGE